MTIARLAGARGDVWVAARPLGSERNVIRIGDRGLDRGRGLVAVAAAGELDVDDGAVVLAASVVGVCLAEAQLAVEDDLAALAQVPGGRFAGLAELGDVQVDGAPAAVVGGDAQRRQLGAVGELSALGSRVRRPWPWTVIMVVLLPAPALLGAWWTCGARPRRRSGVLSPGGQGLWPGTPDPAARVGALPAAHQRPRRGHPARPRGPLSDAAWAKENLARAKQTLPNGYCGLPLQQSCPHPNACLTCDHFLTTAEFLPQHRDQLVRTEELIAAAEGDGRRRLVEMNEPVRFNLVRIIDGLETIGAAAGDAG